MNKATVSVFNNGKLVYGTDYEVDGFLIETDLKEMVLDSLSRCDKSWTKAGIEDDRGILMAIFDNKMNLIPRINPNEEYWEMLLEGSDNE